MAHVCGEQRQLGLNVDTTAVPPQQCFDPREHTLLIRDSKFHKSRLVPLSIDGTREIDQYLDARRSQRIAISPESPLFWHNTRRGTAYTGTGLTNAIRPLLSALQIRTETGGLR